MAESMQQSLERFTEIGALLRESRLFSDQEISNIGQRIAKFENKLAGGEKTLEDFKHAIRTEAKLFMEVRKRKQKKPDLKGKNVEWFCLPRIVNLYKKAMKYYPQDFKICVEFLKFLDFFSGQETLKISLLQDIFQRFHYTIEVYTLVIDEFIKMDKWDDAMNACQVGLNNHRDDLTLNFKLIELHLKMPKKNDLADRLAKCFGFFIENRLPCRFLLEVVELLKEDDSFKDVFGNMIVQIVENYKDEPEVLNLLARIRLEKEDFESEYDESETLNDTNITIYYTKNSIKSAIDTFKQGIKDNNIIMNETNRIKVKTLYLEFLIELYGPELANLDCNKQVKILIDGETKEILKETLLEELEQTFNTGLLNESYFKLWFQLSKDDSEELLRKVKLVIDRDPKRPYFWCVHINFLFHLMRIQEAKNVFEKACEELGSDCLLLWECFIKHSEIYFTHEELIQLYERVISLPCENVAKHFKRRYINYVIADTEFSIKEKWNIFFRIVETKPYDKEIFKDICHSCVLNDDAENKNQEKIVEIWIKQFGTEDPDAYLYKANLQTEKINKNEELRNIYDEALKNLSNAEALERFKINVNENFS